MGPRRAASERDFFPGNVLHLPKQSEVAPEFRDSLYHGCFGHPVVVLTYDVNEQSVSVFTVNSLKGKGISKHAEYHQALFVPILPSPIHPANGSFVKLASGDDFSSNSWIRLEKLNIRTAVLQAYGSSLPRFFDGRTVNFLQAVGDLERRKHVLDVRHSEIKRLFDQHMRGADAQQIRVSQDVIAGTLPPAAVAVTTAPARKPAGPMIGSYPIEQRRSPLSWPRPDRSRLPDLEHALPWPQYVAPRRPLEPERRTQVCTERTPLLGSGHHGSGQHHLPSMGAWADYMSKETCMLLAVAFIVFICVAVVRWPHF